MRTGLALVLVLAVLALPSSAVAAPVVTLRPFPGPELKEGPFITSGGVGWAQARCISDCADQELGESDELYLIRSRGPAGRTRTLFRARERHDASGPNPLQESHSAWLSPQGLAVLRRRSDDRVTLRAGRPGGALEQLFDCALLGGADDVSVALDGGTLLYEPDPCSAPVRLAVRDLSSGQTRLVPLAEPDNPGALHLRGRFAGWLRYQQGGPHLVVFDLETGTEVYTASFDPPPLPADWALGADGTLAAATERRSGRGLCRRRLVWYSVAEPVRHELSVRACDNRVRIENGRIFFVGPRAGGRFLRSVSLGGSVDDHVRFGRVLHRDFDVFGARIAWAVRDCGGGDVVFGGRLGGRVPGVGPVACPTRLAPGPAPVRNGRAGVRLECPRGCSGGLMLTRAGRLLADDTFDLPRGGGTVRLQLRPAARRIVERDGSLSVRAAVRSRDRAFRAVRTAQNLLLVLTRG
jgi:hypothetical protein